MNKLSRRAKKAIRKYKIENTDKVLKPKQELFSKITALKSNLLTKTEFQINKRILKEKSNQHGRH